MRQNKISKLVALVLAFALAVVGFTPVNAQAATKVTLKTKSQTMAVGQTFVLKANVAASKLTFKSSNTKAATVATNGTVTAKKAGKATITATLKANKKVSAKCTVTVKTAPSKLVLSDTSASLIAGADATASKTFTLTAKANSLAYKNVTFRSSNTKVATVTSAGKVTAVAAGTATITVASKAKSTVKATCKVTVKAAPKSITVAPSTKELVAGSSVASLKSTNLNAKVNSGAVATLSYASSNTKVVKVSSTGVVTAVGSGSAIVTVKSTVKAAVAAKVTFKVYTNPTKVTASATATEIFVGDTTTVKTVFPKTTDYSKVTFKTSDADVATVSTTGVVTAKKAGKATITVTSTANTAVKATVVITVNEKKDFVTEKDGVLSFVLDKKAKSYTINTVETDSTRTVTYTNAEAQDFADVICDYSVFASAEGDLVASFKTGKASKAIKEILENQFMKAFDAELDSSAVVVNEDGTKTVTLYNADKKAYKTMKLTMTAETENTYKLVAEISDGRVLTVSGIKKEVNNGATKFSGNLTDAKGHAAAIVVNFSEDGQEITVTVDGKTLVVAGQNDDVIYANVDKALYNDCATKFGLCLQADKITGSNNY